MAPLTPPPTNPLEALKSLLHWILILTVVNLAMVAYDTDVIYHAVQFIHGL